MILTDFLSLKKNSQMKLLYHVAIFEKIGLKKCRQCTEKIYINIALHYFSAILFVVKTYKIKKKFNLKADKDSFNLSIFCIK